MLTGKQKRYLRSLAVNQKAIFQIGKDGLNKNIYISINEALKARELIKISILKTCEFDIKDIANNIVFETKCELIQIIGKTIILYKQNIKDAKIILP